MTDFYATWYPIVPGRGDLAQVAKSLLDLAGDPSLVKTTHGGTQFLVPAHVAEAFTAPAPKRKPRAKKEVIENGD